MSLYGRGFGVIDEVKTSQMASMSDTAQPCLAIAFSNSGLAGETYELATDGATVTIDANGGTSSELLITLKIEKIDSTGTAATDVSVAINGATYDTLAKIVNYINSLGTGWKAWALHAPHNLDTGTDDFIDLAETAVRMDGKPLNCLNRDVSEVALDSDTANWLRIGNPEERDSGRMKLLVVRGTCTGVTNGTLNIFRDVSGGTKTLLESVVLAAAETRYVDETVLNASVYQGPLLIEARSDDLTATNITVRTQQVEL